MRLVKAADVQPGQRVALLPYGAFAQVIYAYPETVKNSGVSIVRFQLSLDDAAGPMFVARCSHEYVVVESTP